MQSLNTVTDRFSLVEKIRKHTPQNNRNYVIQSVRDTFNSPETKERIALGEMYGYYGHGRRAMHYNKTKSLNLPEVSVVMVDGKPVVLENVPSNRTIDISIDDNGIVTHTQEILDTDTGRIVQGMINSGAGGWSWATSGPDSSVSLVKSFHGFDYVTVPNYISLDKKSLMLESAEERDAAIHAALIEQGFTDNAATDLVHHFSAMKNQQAMLESAHREALESELMLLEAENMQLRDKLRNQAAMMESQGEDAKKCRRILRDAIQELPVFISAEQRRALCRMQSEDDARIVAAMLESLGANATYGLPISGKKEPELSPKESKNTTPLLFVSRRG
ncbi:head processing protein [Escherichia coli]|uniref:head processing protein n=1 Tax=Enterobacteriaceae TaxID=543 RepID=UPI003A4DD706